MVRFRFEKFQSRLALLCGLGLFFSLGFFAGSSPAADQLDWLEWDYRVADHPKQALAEFLLKYSPEQVPRDALQRIKIELVECQIRSEAKENPCTEEKIGAILKESVKRGMHREHLVAQNLLGRTQYRQGNLAQAAETVRKSIADAETYQEQSLLIRNVIQYGNILQELNKTAEATQAFHRAQKLLNSSTSMEALDRYRSLVEISMMAPNTAKDYKKVEEIFQDVLRFFELKKLRHSLVIVHYNLGTVIASNETSGNMELAGKHFQKAADIALSIEDYVTYGSILTGLAEVNRQQKKYAQAEQEIQQVVDVLKGKDASWTAYAYSVLAAIRMDQERYADALQWISKAQEIMPEGQTAYRHELKEKRLEILEKMGRYKDSYELLKGIHKDTVQNLEDQAKSEYNKLKVDMGLSLEEERGRLLTNENQKEKRESFYKTALLLMAIGLIAVLLGCLVWFKRQKDKIHALQQHIRKHVLERFFPPQVIQDIINKRSDFEELAQEIYVTIVFCDLVDFTHSAEKLGAQKIALVLNQFFREISEEIFAVNGTIDKFIGDAVMILFGAPNAATPEVQAQQAMACGIRILACMDRLNKTWKEELGWEFAIRIGMHQGVAIVGSFGSEKRSDYTAIGLNVNIAARIEARAHPNTICMSRELASKIVGTPLVSLGLNPLRGVSEPMELFEYVKPTDSRKSETPIPLAG